MMKPGSPHKFEAPFSAGTVENGGGPFMALTGYAGPPRSAAAGTVAAADKIQHIVAVQQAVAERYRNYVLRAKAPRRAWNN